MRSKHAHVAGSVDTDCRSMVSVRFILYSDESLALCLEDYLARMICNVQFELGAALIFRANTTTLPSHYSMLVLGPRVKSFLLGSLVALPRKKTFNDNQPILSFISNGNGMKKKKDSDQHILQAIQ